MQVCRVIDLLAPPIDIHIYALTPECQCIYSEPARRLEKYLILQELTNLSMQVVPSLALD